MGARIPSLARVRAGAAAEHAPAVRVHVSSAHGSTRAACRCSTVASEASVSSRRLCRLVPLPGRKVAPTATPRPAAAPAALAIAAGTGDILFIRGAAAAAAGATQCWSRRLNHCHHRRQKSSHRRPTPSLLQIEPRSLRPQLAPLLCAVGARRHPAVRPQPHATRPLSATHRQLGFSSKS